MKMYDAFINYSHDDYKWVHENLLPRLESHGFDVFIDSKFVAGKFGVVQMEDGVINCRHVIAVFTPEYFKSDWSTLENIMAQTMDPAARDRKFIPILLKTTKIPLRLAGIHYRDLRVADEKAWNQLLQDLI